MLWGQTIRRPRSRFYWWFLLEKWIFIILIITQIWLFLKFFWKSYHTREISKFVLVIFVAMDLFKTFNFRSFRKNRLLNSGRGKLKLTAITHINTRRLSPCCFVFAGPLRNLFFQNDLSKKVLEGMLSYKNRQDCFCYFSCLMRNLLKISNKRVKCM